MMHGLLFERVIQAARSKKPVGMGDLVFREMISEAYNATIDQCIVAAQNVSFADNGHPQLDPVTTGDIQRRTIEDLMKMKV